jgi:hypothetical protein
MDVNTLHAFEGEVSKAIPGFEIRYKNASTMQRVLGWLVFPFNPEYLTKYISTFAPKVFFPSKDYYESTPRSSFVTLAHELVHMMDSAKNPWWFRISYMLPQGLALLLLVVFGVLAGSHAWIIPVLLAGVILATWAGHKSNVLFGLMAVMSLIGTGFLAVLFTGWSSVALFAAILLMLPWPSPGRSKWEMRGYSMNLAVLFWLNGGDTDKFRITSVFHRDFIARQFLGPAYYYMSWNRPSVLSGMDATIQRLRDGSILSDPPYRLVYDFLKVQNEIR